MNDTTMIVVVAVVVVAILIVLWLLLSRRRSRHLKEQFGPEYEHVVGERGDRKEGEEELAQRRERVGKMDLRPLNQEEQRRYGDRWSSVQSDFVDKPSAAVSEAQNLVEEVMEARGYPVGDMRDQEADVSVENPRVVTHFREARRIAQQSANGKSSTEDLRQAMQHYRELFDALLTGGGEGKPESREGTHK